MHFVSGCIQSVGFSICCCAIDISLAMCNRFCPDKWFLTVKRISRCMQLIEFVIADVLQTISGSIFGIYRM